MDIKITQKKIENTKITEVEALNQASWYVVIPHYVLTDKNLSPNAKLIFAEISALTRSDGFCWAGNRHFESILGLKTRQVSSLINDLRKAGYISIELVDNYERKI